MYVFPRKVPGAIYCEIKCLGQSNQNSCPEKLHVGETGVTWAPGLVGPLALSRWIAS